MAHLVVNADLRGQRNEQQRIYAHQLADSTGDAPLVSLGPCEITGPVLARHPLLGEETAVRPFALTQPLPLPRLEQLCAELRQDGRFSDVDFRIVQGRAYHLLAEGTRSQLRALPEYFTAGASEQLSASGWVKRAIGMPFRLIERADTQGVERYRAARQLSLDEFLRLRTFTLDTEAVFWQERIRISELSNTREQMLDFLERTAAHERAALQNVDDKELIWLVEHHFAQHLGDARRGYHKQPMTVQIGERVRGPDGASRYVVHYFEHLQGRDETVELELANGNATVHNRKASDANAMVRQVQEFIDENPFVVLITQNGMSYDLLQLREYTEGEIGREKETRRSEKGARGSHHEENGTPDAIEDAQTGRGDPDNTAHDRISHNNGYPGISPISSIAHNVVDRFTIGGQGPSIKGMGGFFKKVVVPTVYHIDLAPYSQNYFPFTIDNKFATITSLILGRRIVKRETYDDLTRQSIEQILGDAGAAQRMRLYGCEDVVTINEVEDYIKKMVYLKAKLFSRNPEEVCATSKRSLARSEAEFRAVERTMRPLRWTREQLQRYNDLAAADAFCALLPDPARAAASPKAQPGFSRAALYYVAPFTSVLRPVLRENEAVQEIFDHIKGLGVGPQESSTHKTLSRFDLLNTIEDGYLLPHILEQQEQGFKAYAENAGRIVGRVSSLLSRFQPMNRSGGFLCFDEHVAEQQEFLEAIKGLGVRVARGDLVTIGPGSFLLHDGANTYKREVDAKGALGFKTVLQREMVGEIVKRMFDQGPASAVSYAAGALSQLCSGEVEREKLIHFKEHITRDYCDYSSFAQRQARIQAYVEGAMRKGERFAKARLSSGWVTMESFLELPQSAVFSAENVAFLLDDYLGPARNGSRDLSKGRVGRYLLPLLPAAGVSARELEAHVMKDAPGAVQGMLF